MCLFPNPNHNHTICMYTISNVKASHLLFIHRFFLLEITSIYEIDVRYHIVIHPRNLFMNKKKISTISIFFYFDQFLLFTLQSFKLTRIFNSIKNQEKQHFMAKIKSLDYYYYLKNNSIFQIGNPVHFHRALIMKIRTR